MADGCLGLFFPDLIIRQQYALTFHLLFSENPVAPFLEKGSGGDGSMDCDLWRVHSVRIPLQLLADG